MNVVDNAVKWSPADRPVRISAASSGDAVVMRVVDQGPGIDPDEIDAVFEPFQRLGDTSANEGLGLGLAVARGFADLMGGSLELEDTPGGGTTFILTMPAAARRSAHPAGSSSREGAPTA